MNAERTDDEIQLCHAVREWIDATIRRTGQPPNEPIVIGTDTGNVRLSVEVMHEITGDDDSTIRFRNIEMD